MSLFSSTRKRSATGRFGNILEYGNALFHLRNCKTNTTTGVISEYWTCAHMQKKLRCRASIVVKVNGTERTITKVPSPDDHCHGLSCIDVSAKKIRSEIMDEFIESGAAASSFVEEKLSSVNPIVRHQLPSKESMMHALRRTKRAVMSKQSEPEPRQFSNSYAPKFQSSSPEAPPHSSSSEPEPPQFSSPSEPEPYEPPSQNLTTSQAVGDAIREIQQKISSTDATSDELSYLGERLMQLLARRKQLEKLEKERDERIAIIHREHEQKVAELSAFDRVQSTNEILVLKESPESSFERIIY